MEQQLLQVPPREAVDFRYYAERRLTTEKGTRLDFSSRRYLHAIYDCMSREIIFKKSAQCGMSQYSIGKVIHYSEFLPVASGYILPTRSAVSEFSQARFNPTATNSKIRKHMEVDNVHVKQIGSSFIYFRGTKGEIEAFSIPLDIIIIDEKDKCQPDTVESYNERLSASPLKIKIKLSTPTVPGYGIDVDWAKSDQREWFVRCPKCGFYQMLKLQHIDEENNCFRCEKTDCKSELDRTQGEWKPTAKSKDGIVGFHPTQLICPWIEAKEIIKKQNDYEFPADFFNFVLGDTYAGGTETVTRADIIGCLTDNIPAGGGRTLGVDWGDTSWFVCREPSKIVHYGKIEGDTRTHAKQVLQMADKLKCSQVFMDFGYGDTKNKDVIEKRPAGTAWMVVYTKDGKDLFPKKNPETCRVNIDRTRSLQLAMLEKKDQKCLISTNNPCQEELIEHYTNLFEKKEKDDHGELKTFIENKGPDHLAHADNYARLPEIRRTDLVPRLTQL